MVKRSNDDLNNRWKSPASRIIVLELYLLHRKVRSRLFHEKLVVKSTKSGFFFVLSAYDEFTFGAYPSRVVGRASWGVVWAVSSNLRSKFAYQNFVIQSFTSGRYAQRTIELALSSSLYNFSDYNNQKAARGPHVFLWMRESTVLLYPRLAPTGSICLHFWLFLNLNVFFVKMCWQVSFMTTYKIRCSRWCGTTECIKKKYPYGNEAIVGIWMHD